MRHFASKACLPTLLTTARFLSNLENEVDVLRSKLKKLEDRAASDGLVKLYASRLSVTLNFRESLTIFGDPSFHSAMFCHKHLPIVLGKLIEGLDKLPLGLNAMSGIRTVRQTLLESFRKLVNCELPVNKKEMDAFLEILEAIEEAHAERNILQTIGLGILELKDHLSRHRRALLGLKESDPKWGNIKLTADDVLPFRDFVAIQEPLDFCNRSLISYNFLSRMLLNASNEHEGKIGMIDREINLERVVRHAVDEAKDICTEHYGDCPDVKFTMSADAEPPQFPFMSTTIRYIVLELMKNAFRATVEAHMKHNDTGIVTCSDMPPVCVLVNRRSNTQHACIRISDEGNGMSEKALKMAMAYSYTSVSNPALTLEKERGGHKVIETTSPLAGYGYGLPMSRIYAHSFGGDLMLQTMEGYGTRAYYYLPMN